MFLLIVFKILVGCYEDHACGGQVIIHHSLPSALPSGQPSQPSQSPSSNPTALPSQGFFLFEYFY